MHGSTRSAEATIALTWGDWQLNEDDLHLELLLEGECVWRVELQDIRTPAAALFWLLAGRTEPWATPTVLGDLMDAIAELLDPERNLCPLGAGKTIERPGLLIRQAVARRRAADADEPYMWVRLPRRGPVEVYPVALDGPELADLVTSLDRPNVGAEVASAVATSLERMRDHVTDGTTPGVHGPLNLNRKAA